MPNDNEYRNDVMMTALAGDHMEAAIRIGEYPEIFPELAVDWAIDFMAGDTNEPYYKPPSGSDYYRKVHSL